MNQKRFLPGWWILPGIAFGVLILACVAAVICVFDAGTLIGAIAAIFLILAILSLLVEVQ